jgi:hypothetical protein
MPSIFIWKSDKELSSSSTITYYIGSNWFLEEKDNYSSSYVYLEQFKEDLSSFFCFHAKKMPQDWVGSDLLEVIKVPYQLLKKDEYGTLEQLGLWTRLILKTDINFDEQSIKEEWNVIQAWIQPNIQKCIIPYPKPNIKSHKSHHKSQNNYYPIKSYSTQKSVHYPSNYHNYSNSYHNLYYQPNTSYKVKSYY